jgi:alanyl-tRNA synthetase
LFIADTSGPALFELAQVADQVTAYIQENPSADLLVKEVAADGNAKVMQSGTAAAKTLGKAVYLFSLSEDGKVVHLNFVPKSDITKSFTAKTWIAPISDVVGGKVSIMQKRVRLTNDSCELIASFDIDVVAGWRKGRVCPRCRL